jgi:hypothetical protein
VTFREFYENGVEFPCYDGVKLSFKDAPSRDMADLWDAWIEAPHNHIWWIVWNTPWIRVGVVKKAQWVLGGGEPLWGDDFKQALTTVSLDDRMKILGGTPNPFRS